MATFIAIYVQAHTAPAIHSHPRSDKKSNGDTKNYRIFNGIKHVQM